MKQSLCIALSIVLLSACATSTPQPPPVVQLQPVSIENIRPVTGQTVYVPIYSHIYSPNRDRIMDLTATLSVRNTDLTRPIILTTIDYHNTNGERVRQYLEKPVELKPLASADFVVNQDDTSGGAGANFVVEWIAQTQVSNPVVESVMINTSGNQGISLISQGRVVKTRKTVGK